MLLVDDRIGSGDLVGPLADMGLPAELTRLDFADVAFTAKGPQGRPRGIGIELKKLGDLVSSLRTGRLSGHQLPGLLGEHGAYDYAWLLVEGEWRTSSSGHVTVERFNKRKRRMEWVPLPGNMTTAEMEKQVHTLELCGGLHTRYTNTRHDTLQFIANLYRWFNNKNMDEHQSHMAVHTPTSFLPISEFRRTVVTLPGIGLKTSLLVETHFRRNLLRAFSASAEEWQKIEGIGAKTARSVVDYIRVSR